MADFYQLLGLLCMAAALIAVAIMAGVIAWEDRKERRSDYGLRRAQERAVLRQAERDVSKRPRIDRATQPPTMKVI